MTIINIFKGKALLDDRGGSTAGRNDEQGPNFFVIVQLAESESNGDGLKFLSIDIFPDAGQANAVCHASQVFI